MGLLKKKIPMPEASRFDRLDDETLYVLVEQAFSTALDSFSQARNTYDEKIVVHLHNCDTALSDAQAGIRSMLRRKLAIAQSR
jgi:hypothetical protein